jgi:hypothetical protein
MTITKTINPARARRILRERGHSYRTAAEVLGCNFTHLHRVCTGERPSRSLLRKIEELPAREEAAK